MTGKLYITLLAAIVVVTSMTSCEYKELEEADHRTNVTLNLDFSNVDSIPNSMRVAFYSNEGKTTGTPTYFDLPKSIWTYVSDKVWQANVKLPQGYYDVVAWNNNTEHVITNGINNQATLSVTTPEYAANGSFNTKDILDSIYNGLRVLDYPDYMIHSINTDTELTADNNTIIL